MSDVHPGERVHLELRSQTFVLYTDGGSQRIELPYGDADEVIAQLTKVLGSDQYLRAEALPANRSADGHLLDDSPRKLRKSSSGRRRMRPICERCQKPIDDPRMNKLSQQEFNTYLCRDCYLRARQAIYPRGRP